MTERCFWARLAEPEEPWFPVVALDARSAAEVAARVLDARGESRYSVASGHERITVEVGGGSGREVAVTRYEVVGAWGEQVERVRFYAATQLEPALPRLDADEEALLRRDAERYRWIREQFERAPALFGIMSWSLFFPCRNTFDEDVDRLMRTVVKEDS